MGRKGPSQLNLGATKNPTTMTRMTEMHFPYIGAETRNFSDLHREYD